MDKPKPQGGRPRRRPFAAHEARALRIRLSNAAGWLQQARWRLSANSDVATYMNKMHEGDVAIVQQYGLVVATALDRLVGALEDPISPDDGQADV